MFGTHKPLAIPSAEQALPGRAEAIALPERHYVNGHAMMPPYPPGTAEAMFGMGCFWGAERRFWELPGVYLTMAGYSAGHTPNPSYQEVCSGMTGHNEVVRVIFFPDQISYQALLQVFWQTHDPTQGMRQGNDVGTQYRSGIYTFGAEQQVAAEASCAHYQQRLRMAGKGAITSEIVPAGAFYFAEQYHQQYLAKNPAGYCGLGGLGVSWE